MKKKPFLYILAWFLQPLNRVTGRRWADIFLIGIIGGTLCVLLLTPFKNTGWVNYWLTDRLWDLANCIPGRDNVLFFECTLGFLLFCIVLTVFFGLFAAMLAKLGTLRWGHWKSFFLYPPVWLAGLLPLPIVSFFLRPRCQNTTTLLVAYGLIVISSALALLIRSFLTPTRDTKIKPHKVPEPTVDTEYSVLLYLQALTNCSNSPIATL